MKIGTIFQDSPLGLDKWLTAMWMLVNCPHDKVAVVGILQRGDKGESKVRTVVVENRRKKALQAEVRKHVEAGGALYTDALLSYDGLEREYAHQIIRPR